MSTVRSCLCPRERAPESRLWLSCTAPYRRRCFSDRRQPRPALRILIDGALDELRVVGRMIKVVSTNDSGFVDRELEQHIAGFFAAANRFEYA